MIHVLLNRHTAVCKEEGTVQEIRTYVRNAPFADEMLSITQG